MPATQRFVVAIAGPPAAGKSTLAKQMHAELAPHAAVLGMDAFHFDNAILEARGHRNRKGAPHTFDVAAYAHWLGLLRSEPAIEVAVPVFDRSLELTRNCAEAVTADHRIIITEGNYLLLDQEPWSSLSELFDLTVWVDTPLDVIESRILERWADHGLSTTDAATRAESNDLPNARLVQRGSRSAQLTVRHS